MFSFFKKSKNSLDPEFQESFLNEHNRYREIHHAPPLAYDPKLMKECKGWAKQLAGAGKLVHGALGGENLYRTSRDRDVVKGEDVVQSWYTKELDNYVEASSGYTREPIELPLDGNGEKRKYGHLTQVVWVSSTKLGVGVAVGNNGHTFVAAKYDPPGNGKGGYVANVLAP